MNTELIRRLIEEKGWSVNEAARRMDISPAALRHILIKNHRHPRIDTVAKIAHTLGVRTIDLILEEYR